MELGMEEKCFYKASMLKALEDKQEILDRLEAVI